MDMTTNTSVLWMSKQLFHQHYLISNRLEGKYKGMKGETIILTQHCDVRKLPSKQMIMFVQLQFDQEARRAMKIHRLYLISNRLEGKYKGKKGETIILTQLGAVRRSPRKQKTMFIQLQFDQEARRAMILQIGNFKDNVIFCRIPSWFLLFEYLFERSDFK